MDEIDVKKPYPPEAALKRSKTLNPTEAGGLSTVERICVAMTEPLNHHAALVYVMVAAASAPATLTL